MAVNWWMSNGRKRLKNTSRYLSRPSIALSGVADASTTHEPLPPVQSYWLSTMIGAQWFAEQICNLSQLRCATEIWAVGCAVVRVYALRRKKVLFRSPSMVGEVFLQTHHGNRRVRRNVDENRSSRRRWCILVIFAPCHNKILLQRACPFLDPDPY